MFEALGKILNDVHFGPHNRKVKRYLDEATTDSVLEDLKKELTPGLRDVRALWTTFDAYSVEDSSQQRYWNEESLRKHIETVHPDVTISNAVIQLLWRCFHFYAYHPFPREIHDGRIDLTAFQRAVSLLAVQGTELLGTQEGDYFWRNDDAFFRKADFARIFRSIGLPESTIKEPTQSDHVSTSILEDTMDVLAMTQPHMVSLAPSPDQLRPAAQKLLGEGPTPTRYKVTRKDLSTLLSLLIRLRLREAKWGSRFHLGAFDKDDPSDKKLADILMNGLGGDQDEEDLTFDQTLMAMDLLPNLQLRFHQLWAVLFQPPMTADDQAPSQAPEAIPGRILRAISLFIPQPIVPSRLQTTIQDMRIALESLIQPSQRSGDMTLTRLVKSLAQDPHPHVLLFTGTQTATTPATVVGAYFPGPLWSNPNGGEEKREFKTGTSHLLFQLEPQFHLLQWTRPHIPLTDIINTEDSAPSLEAIVASDETSPIFSKPYWIGDPERKGAGLRIDPETNLAIITSNSTDADQDEVVWYKDLCCDGDIDDKTLKKNWEVTVKLDRLDIFSVSGGIDADLATGRIIRAKDQARYMQEVTKPRIQGEELTKRIQGFGPK